MIYLKEGPTKTISLQTVPSPSSCYCYYRTIETAAPQVLRNYPELCRPVTDMLLTVPESAELADELDSVVSPSASNAVPTNHSTFLDSHSDVTEQPGGLDMKSAAKGSREALQDFFQWTRPAYMKAPNHSKSSGTRGPAFYDLHMHSDLRLKKIVIDDGLPNLIARVCDQYFDNDHPALHLPMSKKFPDRKIRSEALEQSLAIINEASLAVDYSETTGLFCSMVAGTLAFSMDRWDKLFKWGTLSQYHRKHGIADGFLSITEDQNILSKLSEEDQEKISILSKHHINEFAIWEFKSLVVGKLEVMQEIEKLEGDFPWTTCHSAEDCLRHTTMGRKTITGRKTGPDAQRQAWEVQTPESPASPLGCKRKYEDPLPYVLTVTSHNEKSAPEMADGSLPEDTSQGQQQFDEEPCKLQKKARDIIQQAWAEIVMSDATYLVISAGNLEFIGFRDRARQTLVLSRLVYVHHKGTISQTKLHTGVYICACYDAIDRAEQLEVMLAKPKGSHLLRYKHSYDDDTLEYPRSTRVRVTKLGKEATLKSIAKEVEHQLEASQEISLRLPAAMSPSVGYKTFQRQFPLANEGTSSSRIQVDAHTCLGGRAWHVDVQVGDKYYPGGMVMKFARNSTEALDLQKEYNTYSKLCLESPKPSFIVQTHGIFAATVGYDTHSRPIERHGLLMAYGGVSLQTRLRNINLKVFILLSNHSEKLRDTLKSLHHLQYIHGKIVPEHIVMNKAGQVFLISLADTAKIFQPRPQIPKRHGIRRSFSVGAISDGDCSNDNYTGPRAKWSEERFLEGYLTKVLPLGGGELEGQSSCRLPDPNLCE